MTARTSHHIAAQWRVGDGTNTITVADPATGTPVTLMRAATDEEVGQAVTGARQAQDGWRRRSPAERAARLRQAAGALAAAADELADLSTAEMGRPAALAHGGVHAAVSTLEQYAELGPLHGSRSLDGAWDALDVMVHEPRGVVAVCTPWNDPVAVPAGLLAAALVTGNTVVLKPSERTPRTGEALARVFVDTLPPGVLSVVHGDAETGSALAGHPDVDVVCHVGSTAAGRAIRAASAATGAKAVVENGGKDPLVIDAGVDPAWAAEQAALGGFVNAGQLCTAVERVYVLDQVADQFVAALVKEAEALVLGPGTDPRTTMGPMVDARARHAVHDQVQQALSAGAQLATGGFVPDGPGSFYPPTVLTDVMPEMTVMTEETFGPVLPVMRVASFDEALRQATRSGYGLAAVVLTGSMAHAQRACRELPVGTVKVNAVFGGAPGGAAHPRGDSGEGFGYGPELLDELTVTKVLHIGQAVMADDAPAD